jgi:PelA/Pel-15E family pectate lyase
MKARSTKAPRVRALIRAWVILATVLSCLGATPRRANHDEAKVAPYVLPDPLRLEDGRRVASAQGWERDRRPELLRLFESQVYGRFPPAPKIFRWRVVREEAQAMDGLATRRDVVLDLPEPGSSEPSTPVLRFTVFIPNRVEQPVPAFVGVHLFDTSKPAPTPAVAWDPANTPTPENVGAEVGREILRRGYALASLDIQDLAPDSTNTNANGALRLLGLSPSPSGRAHDDPGALGAWAWGLVRALDYFSTDRAVDSNAVVVIGHSRMGKAALWAGANDPRFAAIIANGSGCGGAALSKRDFGETVGIITHAFPHWFCRQFATYTDHEERLPVDQHQLIALLAPRPVYLASAEKDSWADPKGEFLAAVHASPVFQLLGTEGLPPSPEPALDQPIGTRLRYHLRRGRHDLTEVDWARFLGFAEAEVRHPAIARRLASDRRLDAATALRQSDAWFASRSAAVLATNLLSHQSSHGSWPKNTNTAATPFTGDPAQRRGTFDNGATLGELRFLARFQRVTGDEPARAALQRGLQHVLDAQYPSGGWPQSHPPGNGYARHITFNDDTMVRILEFLREVPRSPDFAFLEPARLERYQTAFNRGIDCILQCQVRVHGVLTVWCAQHDAITFEPRPARAFEPASLSGAESARVLRLLMDLKSDRPDIGQAIRAGAAWFARSALPDLRVVRSDGDVRVIAEPGAPLIWARFYDIQTNRPIFTGRDGVVRDSLAEIEHERRNGYAWYGTWGQDVARRFADWSVGR